MRVLSWIGGIVLVAVVSTATAAALRTHNDSAHTLTASRPAAVAVYEGTSFTPDLWANHHPPRPSPTPPPAPPAATSSTSSAPAAPAPAAPAIVIGSTQQALINRDRASAGLGPLTWSSCLDNIAVANAVRLSRQGWVQPYHTNGAALDLNCGLSNRAGENVGYWTGGINDAQLNSMFMASAEHYANIMGPYHFVATAWGVAANGYAYIAVEFS
jgi:uncharacterized protein YkwD